MYIKWKKYESGRRGVMLRAELLESYRDEVTREPRSRYIGYLGSIKESYISDWLTQLCFWQGVEIRLTRLSISSEAKEHARQMLLNQVPRPKRWEAVLQARYPRQVADGF